tara:strand:+ start:1088 stop:1438 length:351 start_codon:yes stop_codon:yes gene_type:complete
MIHDTDRHLLAYYYPGGPVERIQSPFYRWFRERHSLVEGPRGKREGVLCQLRQCCRHGTGKEVNELSRSKYLCIVIKEHISPIGNPLFLETCLSDSAKMIVFSVNLQKEKMETSEE